MTKPQMLSLKQNRLSVLEQNGKNIKSPGVLHKLKREIRNLQK